MSTAVQARVQAPIDELDVRAYTVPTDAPEADGTLACEYGYDAPYFMRMLEAGAVDALQADVTRCGGITELRRVGALCRAHGVPLSLHCGPAIHMHPGLALERLVHLEYFHDHVRIEHLLFDGVVTPRDGALVADLDRAGNGLELKRKEAERYAAA